MTTIINIIALPQPPTLLGHCQKILILRSDWFCNMIVWLSVKYVLNSILKAGNYHKMSPKYQITYQEQKEIETFGVSWWTWVAFSKSGMWSTWLSSWSFSRWGRATWTGCRTSCPPPCQPSSPPPCPYWQLCKHSLLSSCRRSCHFFVGFPQSLAEGVAKAAILLDYFFSFNLLQFCAK